MIIFACNFTDIYLFKTCLKNINAGASFPGRREDFDSDAAYQQWRTLETSHLQQLMVAMVQINPELAKSSPSSILPSAQQSNVRPGSHYPSADSPARHSSISSRRSFIIPHDNLGDDAEGEDEELPVGHYFTFIPPNPRKFYKRLLELCLVADLEIMLSPEVDDNDEVSLGILSGAHIELLNECALRWRIGHSYRAACFLDLVRQFFERNDVPMECIPEALQNVSKVMNDSELDQWPVQDVGVHSKLAFFSSFLTFYYDSHRPNTCLVYMHPFSTFSSPHFTTQWMQSLPSNLLKLNPIFLFWNTYRRVGYLNALTLILVHAYLMYRNMFDKYRPHSMRPRCVSYYRLLA